MKDKKCPRTTITQLINVLPLRSEQLTSQIIIIVVKMDSKPTMIMATLMMRVVDKWDKCCLQHLAGLIWQSEVINHNHLALRVVVRENRRPSAGSAQFSTIELRSSLSGSGSMFCLLFVGKKSLYSGAASEKYESNQTRCSFLLVQFRLDWTTRSSRLLVTAVQMTRLADEPTIE